MRVLIMNGPNLNLLGVREPSVYGSGSLDELFGALIAQGESKGVEVHHFQSNIEGELINRLHQAIGVYDGVIFNPGAYTHYSYALRDAIAATGIPVIEVHISNIHKRESFRAVSVTAPACLGQISGLGREGYMLALDFFLKYFKNRAGG